MVDFYKFLHIELNFFTTYANHFTIPMRNGNAKTISNFYIHKSYASLLIMELNVVNKDNSSSYTIIDRYLNDGNIDMLDFLWNYLGVCDNEGHIYDKDITQELHRLLFKEFMQMKNPTNEIHHLGHTFDNRLASLREIPRADNVSENVHGEIHNTYEKCKVVGVNRETTPPVIRTIQELNSLFANMVSTNYLSYRNNPNPALHQATIFNCNRLIALRGYVQ